jgi:hypothetical protein
MQKRLLAPYIQVPDAATLFLVDHRGKSATMSAPRDLFAVSTPKMKDFVLAFAPHCIHGDYQRRNPQQFGECLIYNRFEICLANAFHRPGGILNEWNKVGKQFHGNTSRLRLSHAYLYSFEPEVPSKVNSHPFFTPICDEPSLYAWLTSLFWSRSC